tara:strand:+ start:598 stop:1128 length:531 start_codon:yes stop_codon:yes gene_type:complete
MKKFLGIVVLGLFCQTKLYAIEMRMFLNTHLKCDMIERTLYWSNSISVDKTHEIKELDEDYNPIFISFDKNHVFYSWNKKKKIYEEKDKIKIYDEFTIVTEGHYNFDKYMNWEEANYDIDKLIENPGSEVFNIDRETGKLIEYDIWAIDGAGRINVYMCKKINYLSLPKQKVDTKF